MQSLRAYFESLYAWCVVSRWQLGFWLEENGEAFLATVALLTLLALNVVLL